MHTDEYEISLWRELKVCEGYIRTYRRRLEGLEQQHGMTTKELLARMSGCSVPKTGDLGEWMEAHEALERWTATASEYGRLLGGMKQSSPEP
ncbi:MAG: hypothetical protein M0042_14380 [Nitrospiraceae bacterium]|nr:hypothetical protein [Nitrospiraceae bacterium]